MKKVALFLFLSVCFAQQSCSSDSVGTEPEENPQDILFKDDFNFFDEKVWTKETHEPGWTNQELQAYDAAHVSVGKDGDKSVLILTAERKGNKIYSGFVEYNRTYVNKRRVRFNTKQSLKDSPYSIMKLLTMQPGGRREAN